MSCLKLKFWIVVSQLLACHALLSAQSPDTMYGRSIPIYRSPKDSVQLALLAQLIDEEFARTPLRETKIDSLEDVRHKLTAHAITGRKKVYLPADDYLSSDRLADLTDFQGITRISVANKNEIPALLWECVDLEELELVNTSLKKLPARLASLPRLKTIYIYNNRIKGKLKLRKNAVVTSLSIHNDRPDNIPRSFKKFSALKNLNLAENNIRVFPNGARHNKHLEELNLQRNKITLKGNIKPHPYLQKLGLQWNEIEYVPASIAQFGNLAKLNFNSNKITRVSDGIRKLKKLEVLSFYRNQLSNIPEGVYRITSLKEIDLFHNQIDIVTSDIAFWQSLHTLYLSHNKVVSLPENLDTLHSLAGLYIWDNRLGTLPENIGRITKLKYLRVNGNYLKELPPSILQLVNLEEVDVSHNYLHSIPEALLECKNLKIISIVNNPWDKPTREWLDEKVKELRSRNVFVHVSDESETGIGN